MRVVLKRKKDRRGRREGKGWKTSRELKETTRSFLLGVRKLGGNSQSPI